MLQETKSRLAACTRFDLVNINRYTCAMSEHGVETHHWRKGAQWLSLLRSHAQVGALLLIAAFHVSTTARGSLDCWCTKNRGVVPGTPNKKRLQFVIATVEMVDVMDTNLDHICKVPLEHKV